MECVCKINKNVLNAELIGDFIFTDYDEFRKVLDAIKANKYSDIIIDLSKCKFIDSAALGMLVVVRDEAESRKIKVTLKNPVERVKNTLFATRFDTLFNIE